MLLGLRPPPVRRRPQICLEQIWTDKVCPSGWNTRKYSIKSAILPIYSRHPALHHFVAISVSEMFKIIPDNFVSNTVFDSNYLETTNIKTTIKVVFIFGVPKGIIPHIHVLHPTGRPAAVQICSRQICRTVFESTHKKSLNIKKPAQGRHFLYLASPRGFEPLLPP